MSSRGRQLSEKRWQRVLQHMSSTLPSLDEEGAAEILRNAKADQGTLSEPGDCEGCGKRRTLIATNSFGRRVCGPCGGSLVDYLCRTCGEAGFPYEDGNCDRCVLKMRLRDLFSDQDGLIKPEIQPLIEVLGSVPRPYRTLQWLAKGRAAQLLVQVAREDREVSHELLDEMPLGPAADYARSALVHTRVLPERVEHFGRLETWSKNLLVGKPAHHVRLVRPFIQWHIILRVRRKVQRHQLSYGAAQSTRRRISITFQFLDWLDRRGRLFEEVSQEGVDRWLAEGSTMQYQVRYFIGWAVSRHLIDPVFVPCRTQANPEVVLDEYDHIRQIHRCVNDGEIPLDVRVAGALVLVFGATLARIVCLTVGDLIHEDGESYVSLGRKPLLLPPQLACLAMELADSPRSLSVIGAAAGASHWLFPGRRAGMHLAAGTLAQRLRRFGIMPPGARNAARMSLATDLPAPVIAELFGMHINTAVRWVRFAKRDWGGYVAARAEDSESPRHFHAGRPAVQDQERAPREGPGLR